MSYFHTEEDRYQTWPFEYYCSLRALSRTTHYVKIVLVGSFVYIDVEVA